MSANRLSVEELTQGHTISVLDGASIAVGEVLGPGMGSADQV